MNDKEKQIEEMAKDIEEINMYSSDKCDKCRKYIYDECDDDCFCKESAKYFYNLGYQNCKDKVVLSMEEFDEFRKDRAEVKFLKKQIIDQARKETIERFIVEMKASETLSTLLNAGWETFYKMICNDMCELARQYGVEVE